MILFDVAAHEMSQRWNSKFVESLTTPYRPNVTISFSRAGRYLFNGEDIDTEDFMAYVGLLDEVNDWWDATNNPCIIEASDW